MNDKTQELGGIYSKGGEEERSKFRPMGEGEDRARGRVAGKHIWGWDEDCRASQVTAASWEEGFLEGHQQGAKRKQPRLGRSHESVVTTLRPQALCGVPLYGPRAQPGEAGEGHRRGRCPNRA